MTIQKSKPEALKHFFNQHGRIYSTLYAGGVLKKSERQCDRLHSLGNRAHAIDKDLIDESVRLGAKKLILTEAPNDGTTVKRKYEIPISEVIAGGVLTMRGTHRYRIWLCRARLIQGTPEAWQVAERQQWLEKTMFNAVKDPARKEQRSLFDDETLIEAAQSERLRQAG